MPKMRVNCPNCRQPIAADIEQLFDVNQDPSAKQRLLSGGVNIAQCQVCGYQGNLATLIVYHDPDKELLLTFAPPEIGLTRDDQERLTGTLINQVVNALPQEKRKGYLLRPQQAFTMQGLVERILEADGITKEMLQAQQDRLNLIQRLVSASPDVLKTLIQQEDKLIDRDLFNILARLMEASVMGGDEDSARRLSEMQQALLQGSTFGAEMQAQQKEVEAAMAELQAVGRGLTREKLLEMIINAPNDIRMEALVSMTRPGLDYEFFQLLSTKIDRARDDGRAKLVTLREKLLQLTKEIDEQLEARRKVARQNLETLLLQPDILQATMQNLPAIDDIFLEVLNETLQQTRQAGDMGRMSKLQKIVEALQQASAPPPEVELIEKLLEAENETALRKLLDENQESITPDFVSALGNLATQVENGEDPEMSERIRNLSRVVLRYSMMKNMGS